MAHVTPYISDPLGAIMVVIDGSKDKVERGHAGLGLADYGLCTFVPHDHPEVGSESFASLSDEELCAKIKAELPPDSEGMKAINWADLWKKVGPLVLILIQRLL